MLKIKSLSRQKRKLHGPLNWARAWFKAITWTLQPRIDVCIGGKDYTHSLRLYWGPWGGVVVIPFAAII